MAAVITKTSGKITGKTCLTKSIDWRIPDFFLNAEKVDYCIRSPSFLYSNRKWFLQIFPNGEREGRTEGRVVVTLFCEITPLSAIHVSYQLGIKKKDGNECLSVTGDFMFGNEVSAWSRELCQQTTLCKYKNENVLQNAVTVFCVMSVKNTEDGDRTSQTLSFESTNDCAKTTQREDFQQIKAGAEQETGVKSAGVDKLLQDIKNLFHSSEESDVTVKVEQQEFRAHKAILVARSSVFSAMFRHDTIEKQTATVQISDFHPDTIREFLVYLYTGKAEAISEKNVLDLYRIADKYGTRELKTDCLKHMIKNLSVESICDVVVLALQHKELALLENATKFFANNIKKVIVTVKWQAFHNEYPIESNELLIKGMNHLIPE